MTETPGRYVTSVDLSDVVRLRAAYEQICAERKAWQESWEKAIRQRDEALAGQAERDQAVRERDAYRAVVDAARELVRGLATDDPGWRGLSGAWGRLIAAVDAVTPSDGAKP